MLPTNNEGPTDYLLAVAVDSRHYINIHTTNITFTEQLIYMYNKYDREI